MVKFKPIGKDFQKYDYYTPTSGGSLNMDIQPQDIVFKKGNGGCTLVQITGTKYLILRSTTRQGYVNNQVPEYLNMGRLGLYKFPSNELPSNLNSETRFCELTGKDGYLSFFRDKTTGKMIADEQLQNDIKGNLIQLTNF